MMNRVEARNLATVMTPSAQVLCVCAGEPLAPDAVVRLRSALARVVDWEGLGDAALRHGMAALVYGRVVDFCPDDVPAAVRAVWRKRTVAIAMRSLGMQNRLVQLIAALVEAGVPAMAFKGPALAEQLYGDSTLRNFVDLDVLVPSGHVLRAREVILREGYVEASPVAARTLERLLAVIQEIVLHDPATRTIVELHWREGHGFAAESLSAEQLAGRTTTVKLRERAIPVPGLMDVTLLVAVHAANHEWKRFEDVAAMAAALRLLEPSEASELEDLAAKRGCRRRLHVGVLLARHLAGQSPPPALGSAASADGRAKDLAAHFGARLLWSVDGGAPKQNSGSSARAAQVFLEARTLDSGTAAFRYLLRRLLTTGVNDWEMPEGMSAEAADRRGPLAVVRSATMTQLRRQRRLWLR